MNFKFKYIRSRVEESGIIIGHFVLYSLLPGQGLTIGNALRRVLLSNIEGTAITGIKIPGMIHEFATIPGIREDILEIILNLKQIIIKTTQKKHILAKINVDGPGIITGKSIIFDDNTFVINPNQYIATIATNTNVKFDIILEHGYGYQILDQFDCKNANFFKIDAVFTPVINVNYKVHNLYHSFNNTVECLDLEIITNGSITPEKALNEATEKLILWFNNLLDVSKYNSKENNISNLNSLPQFDQILIEELKLPIRAYNCLKRAGIDSIGQLINYSEYDIQKIKNFGKKSADQLFATLKEKYNIILSSSQKNLNFKKEK